MEQLLQKIILDNSVEAYLIVAGTILLALLIKRIISKYLASVLFSLFNKGEWKKNRASFLEMVPVPLERFLVLLIIVIACDKLTFPAVLIFPVLHQVDSRGVLEALVNAALIITFIRLCIRVIRYITLILAEKAMSSGDQSGNQFIIFFNDFFRVMLVILGGLLILHFSFGYEIGNVLTGLSLVGAAIALAAKESLENLIASFIIFIDKPFVVGDLVKGQNFSGTVEKIGLRSTRIRTDQKTYTTVPNKQMVDTIIDNITMRTQRLAQIRLELSLATTASEIENLTGSIKNILNSEQSVESISAFFSETGKNAHILSIDYFTSMQQTFADFILLREKINLEILGLLEKNQIELAAESNDINIKSGN